MEYASGYETKEPSLYSTGGGTPFDMPVSGKEIGLNPGGLEQTMLMSDKKDDPQPQQDPGCDGCKCPQKGGQDKGGGCGGKGQGGKKDCGQDKDGKN